MLCLWAAAPCLTDHTMVWKDFFCNSHRSKEIESVSYQTGIMLQACCSSLCSSCLKRQIHGGFVYTTDLADLRFLHEKKKKKQCNWLSRKWCKHSSRWQLHVESSHCCPCRLFLNRPIAFLCSIPAVWITPVIPEMGIFEEKNGFVSNPLCGYL